MRTFLSHNYPFTVVDLDSSSVFFCSFLLGCLSYFWVTSVLYPFRIQVLIRNVSCWCFLLVSGLHFHIFKKVSFKEQKFYVLINLMRWLFNSLYFCVLRNLCLLWGVKIWSYVSFEKVDGKESTCSAGDLGLIPVLGRSPRGGHGNPLQYSCLENPHGQRSLADYSPWGCRESDTTERLSTRCEDLVLCFLQKV